MAKVAPKYVILGAEERVASKHWPLANVTKITKGNCRWRQMQAKRKKGITHAQRTMFIMLKNENEAVEVPTQRQSVESKKINKKLIKNLYLIRF